MPSIDEAELRWQIKTGALAGLYVLYGEEDYLKKHYCRQLVRKAVPADSQTFNLTLLEWKDSSADEIRDAAEQLPVFAPRRCVVVRDFDAESAPASETDKLRALLEDLPPETVLVFRMDAVRVPARPGAKWKSFLSLAQKHGCTVLLDRRDPAALSKLLCTAAAKRGCTLSPHMANRMVERCGADLQTLTGELEKLCAFAGGGEITREQLEQVTTPTLSDNVFDLTRALSRRDSTRAFRVLDRLFENREEPVAILAVLCANYVDLYRARTAAAAGESALSLTADFGYRGKEFRLKKAMQDCAGMDVGRLRASLRVLARADRMLKGSRTPPRVVLEQTIAALLCDRPIP